MRKVNGSARVRRSVAGAGVSLAVLAGASLGPASTAGSAQTAPATNTRMLPDISVAADFLGDFSPKRSTQPDGVRFGIREVEVAFQAAVDPYFRGDIFLGFSDAEGVHIEEAFLTATSLPAMLEGRVGRFRMPIGKQNVTHLHALHTIEYPHVIQRFMGDEGLAGTGLYAARVFSPLGFYQELIVTAVDALALGGGDAHGEEEEATADALEPTNNHLSGLGYSARLRNYWDLSESTNLEVSFSGATGRRHQPFGVDGIEEGEVSARQSLVGADITYRWRPLQQGLYKSLIVQAEVLRQLNGEPSELDPSLGQYLGPSSDVTGGYAMARYQIGRRLFLGARGDYVEEAGPADGVEPGAGTLKAGSAYLVFQPSEFSKLVAGFERLSPERGEGLSRILVQASFAMGPHKPHPF